MVKKKPDGHQLEAESRGALTRALSHWVLNETMEDYGIDFEAYPVCPETKEVLPISVSIQLKASAAFEGENTVTHQLDTDSLDFYMRLGNSVLLALYEQQSEEIYWKVVQTYILDEYEKPEEKWQQQETVQIPAKRIPLSQSQGDLLSTVINVDDRVKKNSMVSELYDMFSGFVTRQEVATAVEQGESHQLEFKRQLPRKGTERDAAALANTEGGAILIGIDDSGEVVGVDNPDNVSKLIRMSLDYDVTPSIEADITISTVDEKQIVVVKIPQYRDLPHSVDGRFYKRDGTTSSLMHSPNVASFFRE
ncbi:RNA-binding domain-containing protein [Halocatena pleomorpha]|uniref:DUF4365 domain-containing protein n=1 Tax=Halocatena pleomorpha TaxID=1785090 RepID=A0A3P3RAL2_9EURY|nr:RNA-binding domain-containing protein [Halocatena pleomorpha]RRJ29958.1 DUF4365 domain-containing protein [Halocatena pleomorpha]